MDDDKREEKVRAVQKILGEPFSCEFTEKVWKIRTNLMFVSVVSICICLAKLKINPSASYSGLIFTGLSESVVRIVLFGINLYLLIHFLWCSIDNFVEWRLRLTGTRTAYVTTGKIASDDGDYPDNPRQSTLYNWWKEESSRVSGIGDSLKSIEDKLVYWEKNCAKYIIKEDPYNVEIPRDSIPNVRNDIQYLRGNIEKTAAIIMSERIPASLSRFDNWYKYLLQSQNMRWVLIEFSLPILLGIGALCILIVF